MAVVILAVGMTAVQRVVARSIGTLADDGRRTRAMLAAQGLLVEAALSVPEPGHTAGVGADGLRFERDVARTAHPVLREVRIRVWADEAAVPCELVEVIRVPPA